MKIKKIGSFMAENEEMAMKMRTYFEGRGFLIQESEFSCDFGVFMEVKENGCRAETSGERV